MMDVIATVQQALTNPYLAAAATLLVFYTASRVVVFVIERFILSLTKHTKTKADDLIAKAVKRPLSVILFLFGLKLALVPIPLPLMVERYVGLGLTSLIILFFTIIAVKVGGIIISTWGKRWAEKTESTLDDQLVVFFSRGSAVIIGIIGALMILSQWGIQIGPLLASLGIGGIAIAFALQSSLGNMFGGISLILDKNIKVGDIIQLDADTIGKVIDIGFRSTKIENFDKQIIIIPNGQLSNAYFTNITMPKKDVRVVVPFGVAYGSDVDAVKKTVMAEVLKVPGVMKDPAPYVVFLSMGDSALQFKAYFYIEDYDQIFDALHEGNRRIYNVLKKKGIEIPFPQMDVHMK